eukprot:TRINITY_DN6101_c0_g2_i1.p1 TRINITY_DN6101_c0_g2~~TRINITY_DN6101_c0_g2_i1.p1  ORF type:complete len:265 (-),score=50.10 TRINITY_DN6101_c0_g2_i1:543-1337(-)
MGLCLGRSETTGFKDMPALQGWTPTNMELDKIWKHYDQDKNGYLDEHECYLLLADLGEEALRRMQRDLKQFERTLAAQRESLSLETQMVHAALKAGVHGLAQFVSSLDTSRREQGKMLNILDTNKDGQVSRDEFEHFMTAAMRRFLNNRADGVYDKVDLPDEPEVGETIVRFTPADSPVVAERAPAPAEQPVLHKPANERPFFSSNHRKQPAHSEEPASEPDFSAALNVSKKWSQQIDQFEERTSPRSRSTSPRNPAAAAQTTF